MRQRRGIPAPPTRSAGDRTSATVGTAPGTTIPPDPDSVQEMYYYDLLCQRWPDVAKLVDQTGIGSCIVYRDLATYCADPIKVKSQLQNIFEKLNEIPT